MDDQRKDHSNPKKKRPPKLRALYLPANDKECTNNSNWEVLLFTN